MSELKLNLRALIAQFTGGNVKKFAELTGIDEEHIKSMVYGKARMTAEDLMKISEATGVPVENIDINTKG